MKTPKFQKYIFDFNIINNEFGSELLLGHLI